MSDADMAMQGRSALYKALTAAQSEMKNAELSSVNPHFRSKYADLSEVRGATLPVLAKHGLALTQAGEVRGDQFVLVTILGHVSGAELRSEYPLPMQVDQPQKMGSAITYARRYSWSAICGITAEEDDDGNAGQGNGAPPPQKQAAPKRTYSGPLNITQMKAFATAFVRDLEGCGDQDTLDSMLASGKETLDQIMRDIPSWWLGEGDSVGLKERIANTRTRLEKQAQFGPEGDGDPAPQDRYEYPTQQATGADGKFRATAFIDAYRDCLNGCMDAEEVERLAAANWRALQALRTARPEAYSGLMASATDRRTTLLNAPNAVETMGAG